MDARMFIVRRFDARMLDVGRWMLETLDIGPLDIGRWTLGAGRCMLDGTSRWTLTFGCTFGCSNAPLDAVGRWVGRCWMDFVGLWTLDVGPLDRWTRFGTLGRWMLAVPLAVGDR